MKNLGGCLVSQKGFGNLHGWIWNWWHYEGKLNHILGIPKLYMNKSGTFWMKLSCINIEDARDKSLLCRWQQLDKTNTYQSEKKLIS